jgi:hypothetical protein
VERIYQQLTSGNLVPLLHLPGNLEAPKMLKPKKKKKRKPKVHAQPLNPEAKGLLMSEGGAKLALS